jgi:long-chain acyl-CoA synthetase
MLFDALVFNKVKAALGGKVRYCLTASAPLRTEVQNFLKIVFSCPFLEVYGQT